MQEYKQKQKAYIYKPTIYDKDNGIFTSNYHKQKPQNTPRIIKY